MFFYNTFKVFVFEVNWMHKQCTNYQKCRICTVEQDCLMVHAVLYLDKEFVMAYEYGFIARELH